MPTRLRRALLASCALVVFVSVPAMVARAEQSPSPQSSGSPSVVDSPQGSPSTKTGSPSPSAKPVELSSPSVVPSPSGWGQFQSLATHTGAVADGLAPPYETGWTTTVEGVDGVSAPVTDGENVYVLSATSVIATDLRTGKQVWSVDRTGGRFGAPAIAEFDGRRLLVYTQGQGTATALATLDLDDPKDGVDLVTLKDDATAGVAVDGNLAVVGDESGNVDAIDLAKGKQVWTFKPGASAIFTPPSIADGMVFVTNSDAKQTLRIFALDAATGATRWQTTVGVLGFVSTGLTVADGVVFGAFGDGSVRAYAEDTGTLKWSTRVVRPLIAPFCDTLPPPTSVFTSPAYSDSTVYVAGEGGGLYAIDAASGSPKWNFQFSGARLASVCQGAPVVSGNSVLVGLLDGRLGVVDADSGHLVDEISTGAPTALIGLAVTPDAIVASKGTRSGQPAGGLVSFVPDSGAELTDIHSPTELQPVPMLLIAFVSALAIALAVLVIVWGVKSLLKRREPPPDPWESDDADAAVDEGGA